MRGKYGVLVAFLVLVVVFWGDRHEWGAAAFGFLVLGAIMVPIIGAWRLGGVLNTILSRRDR
jgi:hypothetical protein